MKLVFTVLLFAIVTIANGNPPDKKLDVCQGICVFGTHAVDCDLCCKSNNLRNGHCGSAFGATCWCSGIPITTTEGPTTLRPTSNRKLQDKKLYKCQGICVLGTQADECDRCCKNNRFRNGHCGIAFGNTCWCKGISIPVTVQPRTQIM